VTTSHTLLLVGAGIVAGAVGSAGGITSLVSYPALLAAGVPALAANVANIVALVACWPGSALASRRELAGQARWLRRWAFVSAGGGAIGAVLLLATTAGAFDRVVPFLVLTGSAALVAQPKLSELADRRGRGNRSLLFGGLTSVSAYNGYFGAGAGVMTLVIVLLAVERDVPRANALKNMLIGAAGIVSALTLIAFGPVDWAAAAPLAAGMFAGSTAGPSLARRIPAPVLRWLIALAGLGLAVRLWLGGA
jgi:uncharacterized protein